MVIEVVGTDLSVVQLGYEPAQGDAELAAIAGIPVAAAWQVEGVAVEATVVGLARLNVGAAHHVAVDATISHDVRTGKKSSAVIGNRLVPFQLVEGFHADIVDKGLLQIDHVDRQ
ncbi:hypothetical protein D9M71_302200 [compost metagenome]